MKKNSKPKTYPPDTEALKKWLNTIPVGEFSAVKSKILKELMIKPYKLANWRSGVSKISPLEKILLEKIAGTEIFNK